MNIIEERLRELFRANSDCYADTGRFENDGSYTEGDVVLAITEDRFIELISKIKNLPKDLFTKEQVEELLKKQREICADAYRIIEENDCLGCIATHNRITNAPSPSLEGEKNG